MKKIPSLFKRDYDGEHGPARLCYAETVPGCEWVITGEGYATYKWDGTCCMVRDNVLYKRHDRKLNRGAYKLKKRGFEGLWEDKHLKQAPAGWEPAQEEPDRHTGHWPGWLKVGQGPEDARHREAWAFHHGRNYGCLTTLRDGTYELVGPGVQKNPHDMEHLQLIEHGHLYISAAVTYSDLQFAPRSFETLRHWFASMKPMEGLVFHHPDGRMCKVKRGDFGLPWPLKPIQPKQQEEA